MSSQPDIWKLEVEQRGAEWCVTAPGTPRRMVVSKHATKEAAEFAITSLNASGDRGASLRAEDRSAEQLPRP
jgi:hypothetical protein